MNSILAASGFDRVEPRATGRPGSHPSVLLKLYIYGYLNRVRSSRRLERQAGRNVEVMWPTGRLVPDHKTIADFGQGQWRKDNGGAIRKVCARFVALCRRLEPFAEASVAIDGSKFKAVNARDRNVTRAKMIAPPGADRGGCRTLSAPAGLCRPARAVAGAHEVTDVGSDRSRLSAMAKQAQVALETDTPDAVADRGTFNGEEILACDEDGITVTLPKPLTSGSKGPKVAKGAGLESGTFAM